ncbi:MAG TPA: glycosyltransferase family 2 protein [Aggregatilineales bacterium]|nr:glycosyltransferase family 2 protein [Aggregatilineales bacterium]
MPLISIVVPVYHNAASLPDLLAAFQALAARNPGDTFEYIFVDDGSKDESFAVLTALQQDEPRMRVVKLSRNFGSNAAIMAGLTHARGEAVAAIAADLQDPPELIHDMLDQWRSGRKVVLAARSSRDDPGMTALLADTFYALFRRFAIKTMPRHGFDFFLIDRQICALIATVQESNAYIMGLILWFGFDPAVVYYHRRAREKRYGRSMWTFAKKIKYFLDSFVAFSYAPVRAATLLGIVASVAGVLYALLVIVLRLFLGIEAEGWASLMVAVLLLSGVQLMMLGILGEYLWRNLDETRKRPRFVVETVIEQPEMTHQGEHES